ncbi:unnamed protein product [Auanema sp. JU1783]|nr:unnamed protein product [Auanema sp. JU1783]
MKLLCSLLLLCCLASAFNPFRNEAEKSLRKTIFSQNFNRNISRVEEKLQAMKAKFAKKLNETRVEKNSIVKPSEERESKKVELINENGDNVEEVNEIAQVDEFLYQNDIMLTEEQIDMISEDNQPMSRSKRQAYRDRYYPRFLWTNNIVYYYFDSSCSNMRTVFQKAANIWAQSTCISFVQSSTATNRIKVFKGQGCYSYIGMIGGDQELSLGSNCDTVGIAAHEIGHALGFFHQQSRHDRDQYITLSVNNIREAMLGQFDKETQSTNNNYGMPYDYGSVMHYGGRSSSINGNPTMTAKNANYQSTMGSDIIGFYDMSMINTHYNCRNNCSAASSAKCVNGGYPNPKSCQACVCPGGYGGTLCDARPSGCGSELTPTTAWKTLKSTMGNGQTVPDISFCNYWIKAASGQKIEVRMKSYSGVMTDGCVYGGVEIKSQDDASMTGYRFCSNADKDKSFISKSNIVPVIMYDRYGRTTVEIEYRLSGATSSPTSATTSTPGCTDNSVNCSLYSRYCDKRWIQSICPKTCKTC